MEPVDVLRAALEAVEGAGIPEDLRPLAFTTAVDLVVTRRGASAPFAEPARASFGARVPSNPAAPEHRRPAAGPTAAPAAGSNGFSGASTSAGGAPSHAPATTMPAEGALASPAPAFAGGLDLGPVAKVLAVPVERLDRLYDAHSGTVELCGDPSRFGRTRAERVGHAVLLLLAALRWSGRDAGAAVPDALVRAEVARLGLLDVGNYSKHLAARRALWATSGSGRTATYRLRYDGLEEARRLARTLLDEPVT